MEKNKTEQKTELNVLRFEDFNICRENNSFFGGFTIDNDTDNNLIGMIQFPRKIEGAGFCICLQGECEFTLDQKKYTIKKNDLCAVFPYTMIQAISKSDDFLGYTLVGSITFLSDLTFPSKTMTYLYIKENPCIHLSEEEKEMIINMCELAKSQDERIDHPYRREIAVSQLTTICYEIAALYKKGEPLNFRPNSRREVLLQQFLFSLSSNYKANRDIEHYAQELFITPKYLSFVCKSITGKSASDWISTTVITHAKALLKDPKFSVKEISAILNFPSPSFFGQYFKRHTNATPKEYRKQYTDK